MHTLLTVVEYFRSAVERGFLFHIRSFYPSYINRERKDIFKHRFKTIRSLVWKDRGASIIPTLGVSFKSQISADVCLGLS